MILFSSCSSSRYYQSTPSDYSQNYDQQQTITYQQFYNDLSPYGDWMNYGNYGYVWVPNQPGFRPYYSNGNWVYTDYGWTWVSNYNWGWAPFHYGRWLNDSQYGWMWVPGYEWAPAWVSWRGGGNYYGWAPLAPGMSVDVSAGSIPYNHWTFVPGNQINSTNINRYYVDQSRNITIIKNTTIINNTTVINNRNITNGARPSYNQGPAVTDVERTTGTRINRYNVVTSDKPRAAQVNNNSVRLFRPVVSQAPSNSANIRPERVTAPRQSNPSNSAITRPEREIAPNQASPANSAPVREFPKNQTPQIIRNDPPVNNNIPSVSPERNNNPARVLPRNNENAPAINRPAIPNQDSRNTTPENSRLQEAPTRATTTERVFPANRQSQPVIENPAPRQQRTRNMTENNTNIQKPTGAQTPVRALSNNKSVQRVKANPYKKNEKKINQKPEKPQELQTPSREVERNPGT